MSLARKPSSARKRAEKPVPKSRRPKNRRQPRSRKNPKSPPQNTAPNRSRKRSTTKRLLRKNLRNSRRSRGPAARNTAQRTRADTPPASQARIQPARGETLAELRKIAKDTGVTSITTRRKDDLINDILKTQAEALGYRYNGGTLECMPEGYGFLRPSGLLPSSNDIYVSASQIRRFGLRNGDVVWGIIRPPKDQEHYEALLRVET